MRIPRIYCETSIVVEQETTLDQRASRHLAKVLRLRSGAPIVLFNGDGYDYPAQLTGADNQQCLALPHKPGDMESQPALQLHLVIGISRGERMDYAIQKAVELGVQSILPVFSKRSVVNLKGERLNKRISHWRGVIIAACEQSGRRRLPVLQPAATLTHHLQKNVINGLLLDHRATIRLPELTQPKDELTLLIGPEGGLSDSERAQAKSIGYQGVRLGPRVLRTETAPLAALAAIQTLWGDFC